MSSFVIFAVLFLRVCWRRH